VQACVASGHGREERCPCVRERDGNLSDQNENPLHSGLCQLAPAPDILFEMLTAGMCHKPTKCTAANRQSFEYLVGAQHPRRYSAPVLIYVRLVDKYMICDPIPGIVNPNEQQE